MKTTERLENYRCHVCGYEAESGKDLEEHLTAPYGDGS